MDPKGRVALEITIALINADSAILKGAEPQLVDHRIKSAFELPAKVSVAVKHRFDEGYFNRD